MIRRSKTTIEQFLRVDSILRAFVQEKFQVDIHILFADNIDKFNFSKFDKMPLEIIILFITINSSFKLSEVLLIDFMNN
jgi:hypothetical protein